MSQWFAQTAWLIPCYPFIGMLLSTLWFPAITRRTGPRPAGYLNAVTTFIALIHAVSALPSLLNQPALHLNFSWLSVAGFNLSLPLEISALAMGACILVIGLNFLAQIYAIGYLEMDWGWARFYAMLALFEAGLCALVLTDSLFFSYIILEILTLGTYLLIGIWFNQSLVVTGARDAFLTKRVGDLFLLMGVLAIYPLAHTWDYSELAVWAETAQVDPNLITLVGLALLAGPMGKCAQFPLHLWLDEAMEGPLPSTILRNSVVVATGAWVLVKLQPVLELSPTVQIATIAVGAVTAIGGTLIAIAQIDIKRSLSYLVSAYMGIVFIAVGAGQSQAALLIVLCHAVAMATLVASAGSIVLNNITQDLTQLGGLWSRRPITGLSFVFGALGLVALPPLGGFWAMLALTDGLWKSSPGLVGLLLLINALAAFSITRTFGLVFAGSVQPMTVRSPENLWAVTLPMTLLAGFVLHLPMILSSLSLLPDWMTVSKDLALLITWSSIFGISLGAVVYVGGSVKKPVVLPWKPLQDLFAYDFYTPKLYRSSVVGSVDIVSRITDWLDRYVVDGLVNFVGLSSIFGGEALKYGNSGQTQFYALTIAIGLVITALWLSWSILSNLAITNDFVALATSWLHLG
ncbi:MAG: NAD(P)H-quinone oxidoreductase subunit F [Pegethrix bostrychoides GSE-TBD4-15B]|jgi:NAD(P)H-quinone oxidoreductase subunit 5|uniref:NAD(P)H-quinone oxidoreductase subunit F n=1 Tax=Pegethrix bostrychoides GSE-TBD4-15B TaxID=2839662 RepID=A0A951U536_9CYAN|nr:NAD(P)H-quinone oxidoreductase subunit F [Pegethrix bostrychoides GSE-TBD4-15B]